MEHWNKLPREVFRSEDIQNLFKHFPMQPILALAEGLIRWSPEVSSKTYDCDSTIRFASCLLFSQCITVDYLQCLNRSPSPFPLVCSCTSSHPCINPPDTLSIIPVPLKHATSIPWSSSSITNHQCLSPAVIIPIICHPNACCLFSPFHQPPLDAFLFYYFIWIPFSSLCFLPQTPDRISRTDISYLHTPCQFPTETFFIR